MFVRFVRIEELELVLLGYWFQRLHPLENLVILTSLLLNIGKISLLVIIFFPSIEIITSFFFSIGGWIIDRFNTSAHNTVSNFGTWIIAALFYGIIIGFLTLVPETTLARLG